MWQWFRQKSIATPCCFLRKDVLFKLPTKATSSVSNKFERKISGEGVIGVGKRFTLFILNEDMDDIIKIVESLVKSGLLMNEASETVKHEIKSKKVDFLELHCNNLWFPQ